MQFKTICKKNLFLREYFFLLKNFKIKKKKKKLSKNFFIYLFKKCQIKILQFLVNKNQQKNEKI